MGHKRTCASEEAMTALPPKADICGANGNVRYGPIVDIPPSMVVSDQLGGTRQDNPDLGELAGACINFDCACVLFYDDVVADREA